MATISQLFVELRLSADSFNNGLKEAQREAKEFERNIKPTLEVTKNLGLAMAAAGTAIIGSFTAMSKAAIDYGDSLNDARQRTGRTVEELSKLGFAAEQSGASFDDLSRGLAFLAKNSKATTQDLNVIADAFAEMEDGPKKAKLAFDLFGKSGQALIPLLNEGSAGIRKLGDDAQKAGLVISQDFASASDQINDTLNEVKASALGASVGIAQALLPTLQSVASAAADAAAKFAAFSKEHPGLVQAGAALGATLLTVGSALTAIAVIVPKVQAGFALLTAALAGPGGLIVAVGAAVTAIGAIVYAMKQWYDAEENLKQQTKDLATSEERAAEALKKHGVQIRLDQIPVERRAEALAALGKELQSQIRVTKDVTEVSKSHAVQLVKSTEVEKAHKEALEKSKEAAELAAKGFRIMLDTRIQGADVLSRLTRLEFQFSDALREGGNAAIRASQDLADFNDIVQEADASIRQASYNTSQMQKDFDSIMKTNPGVQIASGIEQATEATQRLGTTFNDVKHTATSVFRDILRDGELSFSKLGGIVKGIFETIAAEILGTMTAKLITPLVDRITGALSGVLSKIPGLGGVFGGAASAAGGAASSAGGVASSAGGLASGATGILGGVIGGGIAALGSLFGSARLEGTLNAVEFNTRATAIQLKDTMDLILQPMLARLQDILAELYNHKYIPDILEIIARQVGGVPGGPAFETAVARGIQGTNNFSINVYQNAGEDGYTFATRVSELLNRYVEHSGGRLIASGVKA